MDLKHGDNVNIIDPTTEEVIASGQILDHEWREEDNCYIFHINVNGSMYIAWEKTVRKSSEN